jgi:hypothetical protein
MKNSFTMPPPNFSPGKIIFAGPVVGKFLCS